MKHNLAPGGNKRDGELSLPALILPRKVFHVNQVCLSFLERVLREHYLRCMLISSKYESLDLFS